MLVGLGYHWASPIFWWGSDIIEPPQYFDRARILSPPKKIFWWGSNFIEPPNILLGLRYWAPPPNIFDDAQISLSPPPPIWFNCSHGLTAYGILNVISFLEPQDAIFVSPAEQDARPRCCNFRQRRWRRRRRRRWHRWHRRRRQLPQVKVFGGGVNNPAASTSPG